MSTRVTEWRTYQLGDLGDSGKHAFGTGPFGSSISKRFFVEEGVPVIRGSNLSADVEVVLNDEGLVFVDEKRARKFSRSVARRGDLVFTCWGTVGQVGYISETTKYELYIVSNKQMRMTPDPRRVDPLFLYYLLSSPHMIHEVTSQAIGTSVPGFNLGQLKELAIRIPPLSVQQDISRTLHAISSLIENNRRRIEILGEMARLLYREWFGHLRFPGHEDAEFVDFELGRIPRGWKARRLGELLELSYGKALRAGDRTGGPVVVYGSGGQVGWHNTALVTGPGIVVGRKGNVGSVYWSDRDFFPIDTTYYVESALPLRFLDQLLRTLKFVDSHAAVPGLSRDQAYGMVVAEPDGDLLSLYETAVRPMYSLRQILSDQTAVLRHARDLLLPRLVSGELDASELGLEPEAVGV